MTVIDITKRIKAARENEIPPACRPTQWDPTKTLVVFDIDGCVIDCEARVEKYASGDYEAYHAAHPTDVPYPEGVAIYQMFLFNTSLTCLFVTSRNEDAREYTLEQLTQTLGYPKERINLLMRPVDTPSSVVPDPIMKPRMIEEAGYSLDQIFLVIEDLDSTVAMWRSRGIACYQPRLRAD